MNPKSLMFQRQIELLGVQCQEKLAKSVVLVAGVGGIGSVTAEALVRLGIGKIYLVDNGVVDKPDLNRQVLYTSKDIGQKKVIMAEAKLNLINPSCQIIPVDTLITESFELPRDVHVVADCLDNFGDRFKLAKIAWNRGVPLVHAGVSGYWGQLTTIVPGKTRKLNEIFEGVSEERERGQIIIPTSGTVGLLQALEIVKLICKIEPHLIGKLLTVDLLNYEFEKIEV